MLRDPPNPTTDPASGNPYEPVALANIQRVPTADSGGREARLRTRAAAMTGAVSFIGFAKWFLPALLGTGGIYTMGIWLEEWVAVLLLGAIAVFVHAPSSSLQPLNYFFCAYVVHLALFLGDKWVLMVLIIGLISTGVMYLGVIAGWTVMLVRGFLRDFSVR